MFINYEKDFDSEETNAITQALHHLNVNPMYINILTEVYDGGTATLKLHQNRGTINRQGGMM